MTALHQGGAINAYQLHLLTGHGTHRHGCAFLIPRDQGYRICRASSAV
ncbi:hypothetical protein ACQPYK_49575 (plasmid) [Streptosporangium sp. CA-135522]